MLTPALPMVRVAVLWSDSWRRNQGGFRSERRGGREGCDPLALFAVVSPLWGRCLGLHTLGADRRPRNLIIGVLCWAARRTRVACIVMSSGVQGVQWRRLDGSAPMRKEIKSCLGIPIASFVSLRTPQTKPRS